MNENNPREWIGGYTFLFILKHFLENVWVAAAGNSLSVYNYNSTFLSI